MISVDKDKDMLLSNNNKTMLPSNDNKNILPGYKNKSMLPNNKDKNIWDYFKKLKYLNQKLQVVFVELMSLLDQSVAI